MPACNRPTPMRTPAPSCCAATATPSSPAPTSARSASRPPAWALARCSARWKRRPSRWSRRGTARRWAAGWGREGTARGGGLEVALVCHWRIAVPSAKLGLPEVSIGLLPGAGGTQRLPRIVGPEVALELMPSGAQVEAADALRIGLIDELAPEDDLQGAAVALAKRVVAEKRPLRKLRDQNDKVEAARGNPELVAAFRKANAKK